MKKSILLASLLVCLFVGSSVFAGRMWYYNEILNSQGQPFGQGSNTAIGMRSGNTWPVVGYATGSGVSGTAAMLPGVWVQGSAGFTGRYLDGATADNGTVAFADNVGRVVMLGQGGWSTSFYTGQNSNARVSLAFNSSSVPGVLHNSISSSELYLSIKSGSTWYSSKVQNLTIPSVSTPSYALDFDSYNQANIVYSKSGRIGYGIKGVMTSNEWQLIESPEAPAVTGALDMALNTSDVPYVLYLNASALNYATYDRHTDSWLGGALDSITNPINFCIAADKNGGVGAAWITQYEGNDMLSFSYNNGMGWSVIERLVRANASSLVGLAFDYENNPVISYMDGLTGRLSIAYDPVMIPEPATIGLLAAGFVFLKRRK